MKQIIRDICGASDLQWIGFLLFMVAASILALAVLALSSDHTVQCYYMGSQATNAGTAYGIMSDINWSEDLLAFTTNDKDEMLEVLSGLKQCAANEEN